LILILFLKNDNFSYAIHIAGKKMSEENVGIRFAILWGCERGFCISQQVHILFFIFFWNPWYFSHYSSVTPGSVHYLPKTWVNSSTIISIAIDLRQKIFNHPLAPCPKFFRQGLVDRQIISRLKTKNFVACTYRL